MSPRSMIFLCTLSTVCLPRTALPQQLPAWRGPTADATSRETFFRSSRSPISNVPLAQGQRAGAGTGRIIVELLVGVGAAWVGGIGGYRIGENVVDDHRVKGDAGYSRSGNVGFIAGTALGSIVGVYAVGSHGPDSGSPWATILGGIIPSLLLIAGWDDPYMPLWGLALVTPLQSVGSAIGFNMTRR